MPPNTRLPIGTEDGDTYRSDEIGGVKTQLVKLEIGGVGVSDGMVSSANPFPVTAATLPLPSGAATAAKQPALGTAGTPSADVLTIQGVGGGTPVPVSAVSLPLMTGAATLAEQQTQTAHLAAIETAVEGTLIVNGSGVTQPISAAALPLPAGAATLAEQQTQTTALQLLDDAIHATNGALSKTVAIGGHLDDVATTAATEGNVAPVRITAQRAAHVNLRTDGGTEIGTAGSPVRTDPTGSTTQPVSGTVTANLAAGTNNIGDVDVLSVPAPLSTSGGGTEAAALRVTLASDSTGLVSVDDNAGSLTVDAPVGTPVNVQIGDGTRTATVRDTGTSDSLNVAIVDGSGNQITTFGGGTEYTEDAAAAANPVGAAMILVRKDTLASEVDADGDNIAARGTAKGELYVKHADTMTVGGTVTANIAAGTNNIGDVDVLSVPAPLSTTGNGAAATALRVTVASDSTGQITVVQTNPNNCQLAVGGLDAHDTTANHSPVLIGGSSSAAAPTSVAGDGRAVNAWFLRNGAQATVITAAGALIGGDATNGLDVDVTRVPAPLSTTGGGTEATALRVTLASDSTGLVSVDDNGASLTVDATGAAAHDVAVSGAPVLQGGYASAAAPTSVDADGDAVRAWHLRNGAAATVITAAGALIGGDATNGLDVDVTRVTGTVTISGTVTASNTAGDVAHDSGDSGNPVKIGFFAETSPKGMTLVADGDRVNAIADADGIQVVKLGTANGDLISERIADTSGTSTAFTNFSAVASTRNYVTAITVYNTSATAGYVDFRDGAAGSVLWTMPLPAGGGAVISGAHPLFKTSANTALAYDVSAALTTVYISVSGFQSKA